MSVRESEAYMPAHLQTTAMGSPLRAFQASTCWMSRACSVCSREFQYTSEKLNLKVAWRVSVGGGIGWLGVGA